MQETTKKNLPLILGLSIPVAMVLLIAGFIYIPKWAAPKPQYDFLYMVPQNGYYPYGPEYSIQNDHVVRQELVAPVNDPYYKPGMTNVTRFFVYDTETDKSQEKSFEEIQLISLNSNLTSPDGYEVNINYGGNDFPFGGSSDYGSVYLKGHGIAKKLNISRNNYNYYDFRFLGWVK